MATLITTIIITVTITNQTGQWPILLKNSQTNSRAGAQPNRFSVCCFVHLCISLGTWWLILTLLHIYVCSITLVFCFKSDNREFGFLSTYPNSALYTDIYEVPKHSTLSTRFSLQSSMYANIIYPDESFHTFTFNTSINIRNSNMPNTNHQCNPTSG